MMKKSLYLLAALWLFCSAAFAQQPTDLPQVNKDIELVTTSGVSDYWYRYTATENVMISLSYCGTDNMVRVDYFKKMDDPYSTMTGSDYCDRTKRTGRVLRVQVLKGETAYIKVHTEQAISLQYAIRRGISLAGESCDNPITLVEGENYFPVHPTNYTFFTYTPAESERLIFYADGNSLGFNIYKNCEAVAQNDYKAIYSNFTTGRLEMEVEKGVPVIIRAFNMRPLVVSMTKAAIVAVPEMPHSGTMAIKYDGTNSNYRYMYKATKDCYVKAIYCGDLKDVNLTAQYARESYPDIYADLKCPTMENGGKGIRFQLKAGEKIYVDVKTTKDITLDINTREDIVFGGETCQEPLPLKEGYNFASKNKGGNNWFTHTAQNNETLIFRFIEETAFIYQYADCDQTQPTLHPTDFNSKTAYITLSAGERLLMKIPNYRPMGFEVEIQKIASTDGRSCDDPRPLVLGQNHYEGNYPKTWYSHTATMDGDLIVTTKELTAFEGFLNVYTSCDKWQTMGRKNEAGYYMLRLPIVKGTTYLLQWDDLLGQKLAFDFWAEERAIAPGSRREMPIVATTGTHTVALADEYVGWYWYEYAPKKDGWLEVTTTHPAWNFKTATVNYYDKAETNPYKFIPVERDSLPNNSGYVSRIMVKKGTTYLIGLSLEKEMKGLTFTLAERDFETGDHCHQPLALTAKVATLKRRVGTEWYQWQAPESGTYKIVSKNLPNWTGITGNSDIIVKLDNCNVEQPLHAEYNHDAGTFTTTFSADKGQAIYIGVFVKVCTPNVQFACLTPTDLHVQPMTKPSYELFPNPTSDVVYVRLPQANQTDLVVECISSRGELLYRTTPAEAQVKIDLGTYPAGFYFVRVLRQGEVEWAEKLIKK